MSTYSFYGDMGIDEDEEKDFPTQSATISRLQRATTRRNLNNQRKNDSSFANIRGPVLEFNKKLKFLNNASNQSNNKFDNDQKQQNSVNDIISATITNNEIYILIDECLNDILTAWDANTIVKKTTLDIESELILNLCDKYESLLDYFYNSSHEICSVLHQIACKIHSMRLLLDGTKMIHIPNNLEQFEKTFGALKGGTVNVTTIRKRVASTDGNDFSSLKNHIELNKPKLRLTNKISDSNESKAKLESKLKNALRDLVFQRRRQYLEYYQKLHGFESEFRSHTKKHKKQQKNNIDTFFEDEYYENDHEDPPTPTPTPSEKSYLSMPKAKIQMTGNVFKKSKKDKIKHPVVECEGCGQTMDLNDVSLQTEVITYEVVCVSGTFFFHNELCVSLRKYKEIIRKYVSESELPQHKRSKNVPSYIKNLLQNFNNLIGVKGNNSLPKPVNVHMEQVEDDGGLIRGLTFISGKHHDSEEKNGSQDISELKILKREREIACVLLNREQNVLGDEEEEWEFNDLPLEIQHCDTSIFGICLWEFVMQQLLTKQMKSLWLLLAYFSMEIPTVKAVELLQLHIADIAKVKNMDHLELVCSAIIENSHYPIATALHLSNFISKVAEDDLSRKQEFQEIADRYTVVAEKLVESVESDHLLSIYLEVPTDLNMMSVFEIAINYEMSDFFDNNRVDRIMSHMWSQFDFLNPNLNFRTSDIDLYELVRFLLYHPSKFYFSSVGRYYIQSVMYVAYVALITIVAEEQAYIYKSLSGLEWLMWICNGGYALFEVMEMTFRGIEYFSDSTNYFDMGIMLNWSILIFMRFGIDLQKKEGIANEQEARNSNATAIYMTIFAIQIIILYCRIATIFARSKTLGPFIRMIGGMMDDILMFAFVCLIFFLGFTFALRYVLSTDINDGSDCEYDTDLSSYYHVSLYVFITLMGQQEWSAVDSNGNCFSEERAIIATFFIVTFSILGTVLLLNLLIAMMATTYDDQMEVKSKEVNFSRTEEIYQLAHRQAIIPPPLNIFVFGLSVLWYIIEAIIFILSCGKYLVNISKVMPVSIDYEQDLINRQKKRQRRITNGGADFTDDFVISKTTNETEENIANKICCFGIFEKRHKQKKLSADNTHEFISERKYCQFCRFYMNVNGNIDNYFALFRGYRLDDDDVKIIKNIFENRGLCSKCYRPYKLYMDGHSNRLARWQVVIEIISFYVFILFLYWSLLLFLCLPALLVGLWSFIQDLADSSKRILKTKGLSSKGEINNNQKSKTSENNYRTLIRQIIAEQTTTDFEGLENKMDKLMETVNSRNDTHENQDDVKYNNNIVTNQQFNDLVLMVEELSNEMKLLRGEILVNTKNKNNGNDNEGGQKFNKNRRNTDILTKRKRKKKYFYDD